LTFTNALTPVVVTTVSGRTKVTWSLGGASGDVTTFWNTVHSNGIAGSNKTLAQLMDLRPQPQSTDPDVNSLPSQVNPLDFMVKNVLRYSTLVILTKAASQGRWALGTATLSRVLRLLLGPNQTAIVIAS
jgi:hypothetical protein